jgi:hypothetical protein
MFGGGAFPVPLPLDDGGLLGFLFPPSQQYKQLPACVVDVASPFDSVCQELGHAYGLEHPLDKWRSEYGDPYDAMAAQTYGGVYTSSFERPVDPTLPVGANADGSPGDPQRVVGPHASAAHLTISPFAPMLRARGMFVDVPPSYASGASSFTLHALDRAIEAYPAQALPVVALIPALPPNGEAYFLELRRAAAYDAGLRQAPAQTDHPPIGIVIHLYDAAKKRVAYVDTLPLVDHRGDRDYHLFGGAGFTFRVTNIGPDFRSAGITIGGTNFWRNFGLTIEDPQRVEPSGTRQGPWTQAFVKPCFAFPVGPYSFSLRYHRTTWMIAATSFGYEQPTYVWTVNGTALNPAANSVEVDVEATTPGPNGAAHGTKRVALAYTVGPDRLTIGCEPEVGNFSLVLEVRVVESSPGVLKNYYEDRTSVTQLRFANMELKWDGAYEAAQKECERMIVAVNRKVIPPRAFGPPKPDDRFDAVSVLESVVTEVAAEIGQLAARVQRAIVGRR